MAQPNLAFLFPGQGSQQVGMGQSFYQASEDARNLFCQAEEILDLPLRRYCFEGPAEKLKDTRIAQPAIFTVGFIISHLLQKEGIVPSMVAGHSLGEYTALAVAGALPFTEGLLLVKKRAELMASTPGDGGMATVVNMDQETLNMVLAKYQKEGLIEAANFNSPSQIVVSGEKKLVVKLAEEINAEKKGKAVVLEVSGAFHSRMMRPAAEEFEKVLAKIDFSPPAIPLVTNVTAEVVTTAEEIPGLLAQQLYSPVLWEKSVRRLDKLGAGYYLEPGGKVVTGLVKKTLREAKTFPVLEMADFKKVLAILKEV